MLRLLEMLLEDVEQSFVAGRAKGVLLDGVVRGWDLDALHNFALDLTKDGARQHELTDSMDQLSKTMSNLGRSVRLRRAETP